jgi:surface protein
MMINIIGNAIGAQRGGSSVNEAFEFTVDTTQAGTSAADQFTIPITSATPYDISTSDGHSITGATGATTLTFSAPGTYTVKITDSCEGWRFNNGGDKLKLLNISNWGVFKSTTSGTFYGASNMTCSAVDAPINPQGILTNCFRSCVNFNGAIGNWDVSQVTQFNFCFYESSNFNQPLSAWDVSNGQQFDFMFDNTAFNQPIGNWNTSNALDMQGMFTNSDFNQNIDSWNVSNVTNMYAMFKNNTVFNQPLNSWSPSSVTNFQETFAGATSFNEDISGWTIQSSGSVIMRSMFQGATSFNQPIGSWNTSAVGDMRNMFYIATSFNQDIGSWNTQSISGSFISGMFNGATAFNNAGQPMLWNTSLVTSLNRTFNNAQSFNADITSWDVSNVTNFSNAFERALVFNQPIGSWNTGSATSMYGMFDGINGNMAFNQDISSWDVSNVTGMNNMFRRCLSFDQPLASWNTSSLQDAAQVFFECDSFDFANVVNWDIVDITNLTNFMYQVPNFRRLILVVLVTPLRYLLPLTYHNTP